MENNYTKDGLRVIYLLEDLDRPKTWLANQMGISYQSFMYKLKGRYGGFKPGEMLLIEKIEKEERSKI